MLSRQAYFPALTGIRAVAAYLVFFHHFPIQSWIVEGWDVQRELHIGVAMFFVLSGFLITHRYWDKIVSHSPWKRSYFLSRLARIFPTYWLILIPTLVVARETDWHIWLLNLSLLKGFFQDWYGSGIAQAWSLTVEECFYLFAPAMILLIKRGWSLIGIAATLCVVGLALYGAGRIVSFGNWMGHPRFVLLYTFFGRFGEFLVGAQLALWIRKPSAMVRLSRIPYPTWLGIAGILLSLFLLVLLNGSRYPYGLYHPLGILVNNMLLPIAVGTLFWGLISSSSWLQTVLSTSFMSLMGKASYAFYLLHLGLLATIIQALSIQHPLLLATIIQGTALLVYWVWEKPMYQTVKKALT